MAPDRKHEAWLKFQRVVLSVPLGWTKEDLRLFAEIADRESPRLFRIIEGYIDLAFRSDTEVKGHKISDKPRASKSKQMHLFDLLREKTLFPQNLDLARFAARVMPHMRSFRFDKMSRSDIAVRIIEHIEGTDEQTRAMLESSMREALNALQGRSDHDPKRQSFLSEWEAIIKGVSN